MPETIKPKTEQHPRRRDLWTDPAKRMGLDNLDEWQSHIKNHPLQQRAVDVEKICGKGSGRLNIAPLTDSGSMKKYVNYVDADWTGDEKKRNGGRGEQPSKDGAVQVENKIAIMFSNGDDLKEVLVKSTTCLGNVFNNYAEECGVPLKSLRFTLNGKVMFLSAVGKKTANDLNLKDLNEISVTYIHEKVSESNSESPTKTSQKSKKKSKKKKKSQGKKPKKPPKPKAELQLNETEEEKKAKNKHSAVLSKIFGEAEPMFKSIRQKLDSLSLECKSPKTRKPSTDKKTCTSSTSANFNPNSFGLGGKAGKTSYTVKVGQIENLYISSKRNSLCSNMSSLNRNSIDLHGCTKDQAIQRLDSALIDWVDTAMKGEYPWVIPVDIICGGGSQILSETVERWIKENKNVANAPKNY